jgi:hypothetical protein
VAISVAGVNDAPVAAAQSVGTAEDVAVAVTLVATDIDSSALTYTVLTQPARGTLSGAAPNLIYTPNGDVSGADSFTFRANDGALDSNVATVSIAVSAVNDAPVAAAQSAAAVENTAKAITLAAADVDSSSLTFAVVFGPASGTLSGSAPNLIYTPVTGFSGVDSFTFKANDGALDSNVATVSITIAGVNDAPVAAPQSVAVVEDTAKAVVLTATDSDSTALTFAVVTNPANGTLSGAAPNLVYRPNANFFGADSFTFRANDGVLDSNVAAVTLSVSAVNDAPVAAAQMVNVVEDTAKGIVLTATDPESAGLSFAVVTAPLHGTLTGSGANRVYTPSADYVGADSFTFTASDGSLESTATVSLTIGAVNDGPVASSQFVTLDEDTSKAIVLAAVDADSAALTFAVITAPAHGTLSGTAPNLIYTPNPDFHGIDELTFRASDGPTESALATITITINPMNDAPVAVAQNVRTLSGTPKPVTLTGTDVDGNLLTFAVVSMPTNGTLTGTPPNLTYTSKAQFSGADLFTFKVSDGRDDSNVATVMVGVALSNDAPVAASVTVTTREETSLDVVLLATDPNLDPLTFSVAMAPAHGTLSGTAPYLRYTPNADFSGTDTFTFRADDGLSDGFGTVTIEVSPVNDRPVAIGQQRVVAGGAALQIQFKGTDVDGDALTYRVIAQPVHGRITGEGAQWTYVPEQGFAGRDQFTFVANDGELDSQAATVELDLQPGAAVPVPVPVPVVPKPADPVAVQGGCSAAGGAFGGLLPLALLFQALRSRRRRSLG